MSSYPDPPDPEDPTRPSAPRPPDEDPGSEYTAPPPPPAPGDQYSAPVPGPSAPPQEALAGFWVRLGGAIIDGILIGVVASIIEAILGIERDMTTATAAYSWVQLILSGAYFTYFHATAAGQTVGNRALGIRVLDADSGGSLTYGRAFVRFLVSYVSGLVLLIGYLWMLWDSRNQTWHDKVANSLVVKSSAYPPGPFGRPAT
jgi:uncharacterized RDD family membrane protein YckC